MPSALPRRVPRPHVREPELPGFGVELADGSHRPLEHDLSRPCRPAPPRPGRRYLQRTALPRRAARLGAHRAHGRLRLERGKANQRLSAAPGGSPLVPAPPRIAGIGPLSAMVATAYRWLLFGLQVLPGAWPPIKPSGPRALNRTTQSR